MLEGGLLDWPAPFVVGAAVFAALAGGAALGAVWWRRTAMRRLISRTLEVCAHDVLRDVIIPDVVEGHIHLDYLLLTARGLVVLDVRDVRGAVFGAEKMDEWAVLDGRRRHVFKNPLGPLHDRVAAVRAQAGEVEVVGRIAFTPRATFPKGIPLLSLPLAELPHALASLGARRELEVLPQVAAAWERVKSVALFAER